MQLPHSKIHQIYNEQIKIIEASLKKATTNKKDEALLAETQEQLDTLAEKYQFDEEIGAARYKLYELQALIHYFNGNDGDALDFINQAIEVRGENYARAQQLKTRLLEFPTTNKNMGQPESPTLSKADQDIISTRQAVQSAGMWPTVTGIVSALIGIIMLAVASGSGPVNGAALFTSIVAIALSVYLIYSGVTLNKCNSSDDFIKKLLITNIAISILFIWTIFPIFIFVTSLLALKEVRKLDGKFNAAMQEYDKIIERIRRLQNKNSIFFYRSPTAVAVLNIVTFGFYSIYWAYKHWALIGKSTKEKTHPVLSAIFLIFTIYPLMKRIRDGSSSHGYKQFRHAGWAATGFIILEYLSNGIGKTDVSTTTEAFTYIILSIILSAGAAAIMATVQKAANAHTVAVLGSDHNFKKTYTGEIIMTTIGVILGILIILGTFSTTGTTKDPLQRTETQAAYRRAEALRSEYDSCSSQLAVRRSTVDAYNSDEVDSFNNDLQQCENTRIQLNEAVDEYNSLAGINKT